VNQFFLLLGIESWKPVIAALLLPPVPLLVLILVGARLMLPRRGVGWFVIIVAVAGLWLSACLGAAQALSIVALPAPPALSFDRIKELREAVHSREPVAIVVLGAGMETYAPEYGVSNLRPMSIERLRYGLWLAREIGAPVAYSGGVGHGSAADATPEAEVAGRAALGDFNRPLRWLETDSRDTRENALRTVTILKPAGIQHVILVTHAWHMPRAMRAFAEAAPQGMRIEAAPMGLSRRSETAALAWIPSTEGFALMRHVLHELVGLAAGS
jgi:uncharacterized SAM-binding protein YcdF (DUF218 family)